MASSAASSATCISARSTAGGIGSAVWTNEPGASRLATARLGSTPRIMTSAVAAVPHTIQWRRRQARRYRRAGVVMERTLGWLILSVVLGDVVDVRPGLGEMRTAWA